ncbi:MAG: hypothetical protein ABIY55_31785 [Kofleriaceae bacterium]
MAACSSDSAPPSCQQAISHYYAAGCRFVNLETGAEQSQSQAIAGCQSASSETPDRCDDEVDDWLRCIDSTSAAQQCDCSQEQMSILRCV